MDAWLELLRETGCVEHCPDEFTWKRNFRNGYVLECLDVSLHNVRVEERLEHSPACTVSRYVPNINASDHLPVELEFVRRRRPKIRGQLKAPTHIPAWLYANQIFKQELEMSVRAWHGSKLRGMEGLREFADIVQLVAKECLERHVFVATTAEHKFDVVAAALRTSVDCHGERNNMHALSFCKAARFCKIVPALESAIVWDLDTDGTVLLDVAVAREQLRALHQDIISQRNSLDSDSQVAGYGNSLQTGTCKPYTLQRVKEHLPRNMHHVVKLWDEDAQDYTYEDVRIAELLARDANKRQGAARGDVACGEDLLRHASLDLRQVRNHVHDDEVLNAILDGSASASPGPNGVRGHPYHEHAGLLIEVFREAFEDIVGGVELSVPLTEGLLRAIGKVPDPSSFKQIRDLELPNFDRKVIERLFCLVLDECASRTLSQAQVACIKGRDVAQHILRFNDVFEQAASTRDFLATLSLDCSKGFNRMSHSWIQRVLRAAGCPETMVAAIMRMVCPMVAYLVHNQRRMSRLEFMCGLRQGGPLSAMLYILAVDPLLCAFRAVPNVVLVLGYVDDWLAAARDPEAIPLLQTLCDEFERASGQVFNTDKSVILYARTPTFAEAAIMQSRWHNCKLVARHKIVGILYGAQVRPEERYSDALVKIDARLSQLSGVNMSVNMRIVTANVFVSSHLSYLNRFFMMPDRVVRDVHNKLRQFVTRLSIGAICVWTHCLAIMKSRVVLSDVRLQNVALLTCTAAHFAGDIRVGPMRSVRWMDHCVSCMSAAHWYFYAATGESAQATISKGTRAIYQAMLRSELPAARAYLRDRLQSRNLSSDEFFRNIACLPASIADHHRVNTLMWALNGLATSHRVATFRDDVSETQCKLCGAFSDTLVHLTECGVVKDCISIVVHDHAAANPQDAAVVAQWPPCAHFLQDGLSQIQIMLIVRINCVIWHVRCAIASGRGFADRADLVRHMVRMCAEPMYHTRARKERRAVQPAPIPTNAVLYRSDGAARGQGRAGEIKSGAGAVFYGDGAAVEAWACVNLRDVSNNIAEYVGALMVLERIVRQGHEHSVLQMDSMLVTMQLRGGWRVAADDLVPYFRKASALLKQIRQQDLQVDFVHIYREFNKDADEKANLGADGMRQQFNW